MKEIFNSLSQKETKVLKIVAALLALALLFLVFTALGEGNAHSRSLSSLSSKEKEYQSLNFSKMEMEKEWKSWETALQDIQELRISYFYEEKKDLNQLRLDLQKLFDESRMNVSQIRYTYTQFKEEKIKKVSISFNISGSYFSLKKFINSVEKLSRFLLVEKIDFLDTSADGNFLTLKMSLAGYYAL
jgi:Tfp pilus assembly protein PilO